MTDNENVTVIIHNQNVQNNDGCFSGCGFVFIVLIVMALIAEAVGCDAAGAAFG